MSISSTQEEIQRTRDIKVLSVQSNSVVLFNAFTYIGQGNLLLTGFLHLHMYRIKANFVNLLRIVISR